MEAPHDPSSQVFTIGKVDAGIAVLISDSVHLIEFPSLLLPAGVGPGSIVNISCSRNFAAERATTQAFWDLQRDIFSEFGEREPEPPKLRVRNVTQTSVTLEWDKLELAQAKLLGLSIWRNGQRLTTIPNPLHNTSTKLSGLSLDTDYSFHLVLKTSAGTYASPIVKIRTHTIADTSGVAVCFGLVEPTNLLDEAQAALVKMKARSSDKIQIDTTHFVATSPASVNNPTGGPGVEYQKALQLSIPVVSPEWVIACAREQKMVPIANYYSIGTTNHAASLSSAQLVNSSGQIPKHTLPRRATVVSINEDAETASSSSHPVPAVAPAPATAPRSELEDEEPDAPPAEVPYVPSPVPEVPEAPEAPEITVEAPEEDPAPEVSQTPIITSTPPTPPVGTVELYPEESEPQYAPEPEVEQPALGPEEPEGPESEGTVVPEAPAAALEPEDLVDAEEEMVKDVQEVEEKVEEAKGEGKVAGNASLEDVGL
ncbi:chitin synthase [Pseudohyphozyma bogoriensis]|nr:chitin synthase [Pseudohyphozyma bogoriensis]